MFDRVQKQPKCARKKQETLPKTKVLTDNKQGISGIVKSTVYSIKKFKLK